MKIFLFIILLSISAWGQAFDGAVVSVKDGDSFAFRHNDGNLDNVRLLGLDAPEVARSKREIAQPFGDQCKKFLALLIEGKTVSIEAPRRDVYGRNLARVLLNGLDVNLTILQVGCGWIYYLSGVAPEFRAAYELAFLTAKANKTGLFAKQRIVTPTVWRRKKHFKRKPK